MWIRRFLIACLSKPSCLHIDHHGQTTRAFLFDIVVGGVVRDVAMDEPLAGLSNGPHDILALAGADIQRIGFEPRGGFQCFAVACHHGEGPTVHMQRVYEIIVRTYEA